MPGPRRRPLVALVAGLAAVGLLTGGLAWLLDAPAPPPGASRAQRLYLAYCADCHGTDGRGSWRAILFLIRPGDLTDQERLGRFSDRYLFDLIKHGGAPIGRPGMPAFGSQLSDADIEALVGYVRQLGRRSAGGRPATVDSAWSRDRSGLAFDAEQDQLVSLGANGESDAIAGPHLTSVE